MQHAALRQPDRDVARIVEIVHINKLDGLAAEVKRHALLEAQHSVDRAHILERLATLAEALAPGLDLIGLVGAPVLGDALLHDYMRGRRERRRATSMIAMVLRDDNVANRLAGH